MSLGKLPLFAAHHPPLCLKAQPLHLSQQRARLQKSIILSHDGSLNVDVSGQRFTELAKHIESGIVCTCKRLCSHL